MKLTEIESVKKTIELWEWAAETGKRKWDWPEWVWNGGQYAEVANDCFLCKYVKDQHADCWACPYCKKYGHCMSKNSPYRRWVHAKTIRTKKKYATEILEQLKEIVKDLEGK